MRLENISFYDAEKYFEKKDIVIIPIGSIENHGAHLALGTDYLVPKKIVELIENKIDILIAPPLAYGNSDSHMDFSGTVSIGDEGLYIVMKNIVKSLYTHGARRFIFLNGHGGNTNALNKVGIELNKKGGISAILNWWQILPQLNDLWLGGHAGAQETSVIMAINEDLVDLSKLEESELINPTENIKAEGLASVNYKGVSFSMPRTTINITKSGWSKPGHPNEATKECGEEMLKALADFYCDFIEEFEKI